MIIMRGCRYTILEDREFQYEQQFATDEQLARIGDLEGSPSSNKKLNASNDKVLAVAEKMTGGEFLNKKRIVL